MNGSRNIGAKALWGAVAGIALAGLLSAPAAAAGQNGGSASAATLRPKVVATVTGAGVTVTFLAESGPDGLQRISLREEGSLDGGASPVAALVAQRYTAQEIYLALAPSGAKAPAALAKVQGAEAAGPAATPGSASCGPPLRSPRSAAPPPAPRSSKRTTGTAGGTPPRRPTRRAPSPGTWAAVPATRP